MKKQYLFLALIPIVLSVILAILPDKSHSLEIARDKQNLKSIKYTGVTPEKLLLESTGNERLIQPDELAKIIMGKDPSYQLVDLRDSVQFEKFSLPNALNIAADRILDEEYQPIFQSDDYNVVLFSNGTILSDQVWMVLRRAGYKNIKVLNGGLNQFYQLFLNPPKPAEIDPQEIHDEYSFRKAVGVFMGLPNPEDITQKNEADVQNKPASTQKTTIKAPVKVVVPKKVESGASEGC